MNSQQALFSFDQLNSEIRAIVQKEDREFDQNMDDVDRCLLSGCHNLSRIHEALKYEHPGFVSYVDSKPGLSRGTAYNMLNVAKMFPTVGNISIQSRKALYLLASPSTPEEVRQEAIDRAAQGEIITPAIAKGIINRPNPTSDEILEALDGLTEDEGQSYLIESGLEEHAASLGIRYNGDNTPARDWLRTDDPEAETEAPETNGNRMSQPLQVLLSHEATEWYTPAEYIEAARAVMGGIDLDPASSDQAQEIVRAKYYFTVETNGLSQDWLGRVWLNPPYSTTEGKSNQELWSQYLIEQYRRGSVTEAILLVKSSLGYNWFERIWDQFPVCFARELISFIKPGTPDSGKAKLGSAFFYLGPNLPRFSEVFSRYGRIVTPKGETL